VVSSALHNSLLISRAVGDQCDNRLRAKSLFERKTMHGHPLWTQITLECKCCKIPREFTFKSASDHVICKCCERHIGDSAAKRQLRNEDHAGLYRSELLMCREDRAVDARQHAAELQELHDRIAQRDDTIAKNNVAIGDLQAVIRTGELNPAVERWLADEEVKAALEKRDGAYRSRDFAFATIWRLAKLHHPDEHRDGWCSCGRKDDRCKELEAIYPELHALRHWEETQIQRLHDELEHGLPNDHPEVMRLGGPYLRRRRHA
jgi:hypothetical protein